MKQKLVGILVSMLLIATALSVAGTTNNNEDGTNPNPARSVDWWPMFRHDPENSGFSTSGYIPALINCLKTVSVRPGK